MSRKFDILMASLYEISSLLNDINDKLDNIQKPTRGRKNG
jgi:hypothetical protein